MTLTSPDTPLCFTIQMHRIWVVSEGIAFVTFSQKRDRTQKGGESLGERRAWARADWGWKCASCWDDQTPLLRVHSLPVTLPMMNTPAELPGFTTLTQCAVTRTQPGYPELGWVTLGICLHHWDIANWSGARSPPSPLTTCRSKGSKTIFNISAFSLHIFPSASLLLRGV